MPRSERGSPSSRSPLTIPRAQRRALGSEQGVFKELPFVSIKYLWCSRRYYPALARLLLYVFENRTTLRKFKMTILSVSSQTASPLQLAIQQMDEESTETLADTKAEALQGDPVAQRLLEYRGDPQVALPPVPYPQDAVGSLLNAKA